jgi:hypothetical protein
LYTLIRHEWKEVSRLWIVAVNVERFMVHRAMFFDRTQRRANGFKPFARSPDGVAASLALAFEHPRYLLLRRGGLSAGIELGVAAGAS